MNQNEFNDMLHAEDMPVCQECTVLLKDWAESDPRLEQDHDAWAAFVAHRQSCSAAAGLRPTFYVHPVDIPGEQEVRTSEHLFLVREKFTKKSHEESLRAA